jgi:hypothetical protein
MSVDTLHKEDTEDNDNDNNNNNILFSDTLHFRMDYQHINTRLPKQQ